MRKIEINFVPSEEMRYDTLGDYRVTDDEIEIDVVNDTEFRHQALIAIHELVEVVLCIDRGISMQDIDAHDLGFVGDGEPGDQPDSPYRREHRFAMMIEHLIAHELGIDNYGVVM
jgi:hypothetical protein